MAEEPGRVFSRYLIGRLLGEGGMGQVYEAEDTVLHRRVALKFLREPSPEFRKRFLHEAQMQAGLDHENICKVYDVGERDGQAYIAMQFLTGETLNKTAPFMTLEQKVKVLMEVAEAVQAAHRLGLIHRDLKPENVMIETREGEPLRPYVMDFGLARELSGEKGLTMTGMIVGTPSYMSPEQVRGDITQLDRRTDVYSLGVTLYEVLTGRTPFDGKSTVDVMMAILQKDPVPLRQVDRTLPEDLETVGTTRHGRLPRTSGGFWTAIRSRPSARAGAIGCARGPSRTGGS